VRFGNADGDHRRARAGATSIWEDFFACNRAEQPFIGKGRGKLTNCATVQ
jgi:hypothetical protein